MPRLLFVLAIASFLAAPGRTQAGSAPVTLAPSVGSGQLKTDVYRPPNQPTLPRNLDQRASYWALLKICVSTTGRVNAVGIIRSTGYGALDARWTRTVRKWRYQPYRALGRTVPFCYPTRLEVRGYEYVVSEPVMVAPSVGTGQRMSDLSQAPHRPTLPPELHRPGAVFWGLYKICLSRTGETTGVEVIKSSDNVALDQRWMSTIRTWRYKPYTVNGRPVAYCYPTRIEVRS